MLSKKHTEKSNVLCFLSIGQWFVLQRFHVRGRKCGWGEGGGHSLGTSGFQVSRHPSHSLPPRILHTGQGQTRGRIHCHYNHGFIVTITTDSFHAASDTEHKLFTARTLFSVTERDDPKGVATD
jgi:hypothetical protein